MAQSKLFIINVPEGVELLRIGPVEHMVRPTGGKMKAIRTIDVEDLKSGNFKQEEHECRWYEKNDTTREGIMYVTMPGEDRNKAIKEREDGLLPHETYITTLEDCEAIKGGKGSSLKEGKGSSLGGQKTYISYEALQELIRCQLKGKFLRPDPIEDTVVLGDDKYYCPPLEDAASIIDTSDLEYKKWVRNAFDCDDFAYVLKAHFAEAAYLNGTRERCPERPERPAHCFGIVFAVVTVHKPGEKPNKKHALNWMVNDDLKVRFVEPQAGGYVIDPEDGRVFRVDPQNGQELSLREGDPKTVEIVKIGTMVG